MGSLPFLGMHVMLLYHICKISVLAIYASDTDRTVEHKAQLKQ